MKKIIFTSFVALLMGGQAQASHWFSCSVEADVSQIYSIDRLNGTTVRSNGGMGPTPDFDQIVDLEITSVTVIEGASRSCGLMAGEMVILTVNKDEQDQYTEGDKLRLIYKNVGDARGSRISWQIDKPTPVPDAGKE